MSRTFFVLLPQRNSGGPRTGFFCQELFAVIYQNYPKFAHPFRGLPKFAQIIPAPHRLVKQNYLHYSRKKYLTSSANYCIIGAPAPKDHSNCKKFCPHPQKRLDNSSTTTYNGARYLWENSRSTTTGAGAPKISMSQEIFGGRVPRGTLFKQVAESSNQRKYTRALVIIVY